MSPADLQNEIMRRLRVIFEDFPLDTEGAIPLSNNDTTPFKIFRQTLPETLHDMTDYREEEEKDKDIYPFVIVNLPGGSRESYDADQIEPVAFLVGVKNDDYDNRGFSDVQEAVQHIMDDFYMNPIVADLYQLEYPVKWKPYEEENTFPYFFAQIEMSFVISAPTYRGGLDNDDWN